MMAKYLSRFVNVCTIHNVSEHYILKCVSRMSNYSRHYSSALLVPGSKRTQTFSFLTPHLDFDNKVENLDKLEHNLRCRGQTLLNADDVKKMWKFYKFVTTDKCRLEERSDEISKKMSRFFKKTELTEEEQAEFTKLKLQNKTVKDDLKSVKNIIDDLQESVLLKLLQLPNELDNRTPHEIPKVLKHGKIAHHCDLAHPKSHIKIGRDLGLLEFKNPMQYFLCNEAALFELGVLSYAGKVLGKSGLIRVAGSDFSRSVVVEGCGLNHEKFSDAFVILNHSDVNEGSSNRMHLVGGASLISFLAMHTKQLINPKHLPVGYFSTGRQYNPYRAKLSSIGLFNVCQASTAVTFVLAKDSEEYHKQYEMLFGTVCSLYDNICNDYEIVIRPASQLKPWESMRVSFELWSTCLKQYVEVGHISLCGNYFSKRLLIAYQTSTGRDFPFVISGTVLSVPRLLGCLLEQHTDKFEIPASIRNHMPDYTSQ